MPVYNEERTIEKVVSLVLEQDIFELVVIDDGSTDRTTDILTTLKTKDKRIVFSQLQKNEGKGRALMKGFELAGGDIFLVQDADLEYHPSVYSRLIEAFKSPEVLVVYGSRFLGIKGVGFLWSWQMFVNKVLTFFANQAFRINITDMHTCYKVFRREVLQDIVLQEKGFGFCTEFTGLISSKGIKIYEVPVDYVPRTRKEGKKISWKDGVRNIRWLWKYRNKK